jgi:hypothetical protein
MVNKRQAYRVLYKNPCVSQSRARGTSAVSREVSARDRRRQSAGARREECGKHGLGLGRATPLCEDSVRMGFIS